MIRVERVEMNPTHPDDKCEECGKNGFDSLFKVSVAGSTVTWLCHSDLKSLQWAITEAFR